MPGNVAQTATTALYKKVRLSGLDIPVFCLTCFPFLLYFQIIMDTNKRLGFVGIIIEDRGKCSHQINEILSANANLILARTGIPHIKEKTSVITLVVDATTDELGKLTGRLGSIEGVQVKSGLAKR